MWDALLGAADTQAEFLPSARGECMYSVSQAAKDGGVAQSTLGNYIRKGLIKAEKVKVPDSPVGFHWDVRMTPAEVAKVFEGVSKGWTRGGTEMDLSRVEEKINTLDFWKPPDLALLLKVTESTITSWVHRQTEVKRFKTGGRSWVIGKADALLCARNYCKEPMPPPTSSRSEKVDELVRRRDAQLNRIEEKLDRILEALGK